MFHGHGARTGGRAVAVQLLRLSDGPDETSLANLNDQGETFGVIAAVIEQELNEELGIE